MSIKSNPLLILQKAKISDAQLYILLDIGRIKGFQTFLNRKSIWSFLLGIENQPLNDYNIYDWKDSLDKSSKDYQQLQKDAQRSLSSMKIFQEINKLHLRKRQEAVLSVLDSFFAKNQQLRYIQGFHDVASIFLIIYGNNPGYYMMQKAGKTYFRDFLTYQFGYIGQIISSIVFDIVTKIDPTFSDIYQCYSDHKFLIFILPWILTWFSHVFSSVKTICRIWDYILCTGPHGIIYLTAAIILVSKQELQANCTEFDEPNIQTFYQEQVKKQSIDIQKSIQIAINIQSSYEIKDFESYKDLKMDSIFRLQNLYPHFPWIKKYHEKLKSRKQMVKIVGNAFKVGSIVLIATVYLLYRSGFGNNILKNGGEL